MYVYKYNLIVYGIRWCSCRVENILTLGKLLRLWFCFHLHSILFLISQTSYRTYKIISSYELARPIMGTIFLVWADISLYASLKNSERGRYVIGRAKRAPHWGVQSRFRVIYVGMYVCRGPKSVGGNTWAKRAHAQSEYWATSNTRIINFDYTL